MNVFLDSSAYAKLFIDEEGSEQVEVICAEASQLGLGMICYPEIISAFSRRSMMIRCH